MYLCTEPALIHVVLCYPQRNVVSSSLLLSLINIIIISTSCHCSIKCTISYPRSNFLSSNQAPNILESIFTLTISARRSNPVAVVVKWWSKARVEVEMLHSGTEGVLRADTTAALSMVHWRWRSVCFQSGCRFRRGSRVPVPDSDKDTPLWADEYCISAHISTTIAHTNIWVVPCLTHFHYKITDWRKMTSLCWVL